MNKLKKLIILFLICSISLIHSMHMQLAFETETESEFIARTKKLPRSQQYTNTLFELFIEPSGAYGGFHVTCPYDRNQVLLRPAENGIKSQLVVINSEGHIYARQFLGRKKIMAIALAANRELFAAIYQKHYLHYPAKTTDILKVKELGTKKTVNKSVLPKTFETASAYYSSPVIAFNKQGTHVIVWGVDVAQRRSSYKGNAYGTPALDYMIFSISNDQ